MRITMTEAFKKAPVPALVGKPKLVDGSYVFKDVNGALTSEETSFQIVILTENATEQVKFVSMNTLAKRYTVRVRQAR